MCGRVCVYEEGCVFLCTCKGQGRGDNKNLLAVLFLFLYGSRCLLVFWVFFLRGGGGVWGGKTFRTVLTVAEGSITGALVGIHKVCCPGWCTLISLAWTSIL